MKRGLFTLFALVPLLAFTATDPCLPAKPASEDHLVFQFTDFLSEFDADRLDGKLTRFAQETSNRIVVVVVDDLCGYDPSGFAFELGEAWGIGGKNDNGILVLVKPTGTPGERKVFIATGYGLEGAIPDALARRIVEDEIIPRFKQHAFYEGLHAGTDVLMKLAKGEISEESYGSGKSSPAAPLFVFGALLIIIVLAFVAQRGKVNRYAHTNGIDFWSAWWLLNQATRSHRGSWGGFTGGGGGFSGGGGGGFGGFGGGSFGGGGAGGSW